MLVIVFNYLFESNKMQNKLVEIIFLDVICLN